MNVPDDWSAHYRRCSVCGEQYHASEGGCGPCSERELEDEADEPDEEEDDPVEDDEGEDEDEPAQ